jgi:predicted RNase H-like HicB family nuclease
MFDSDSGFSTPFTALITRDEDGWSIAQCKELPGVVTQGRTLSQVCSRFSESLEGHLEALAELRAKHGKPSKNQVVLRTFQYELSATPV